MNNLEDEAEAINPNSENNSKLQQEVKEEKADTEKAQLLETATVKRRELVLLMENKKDDEEEEYLDHPQSNEVKIFTNNLLDGVEKEKVKELVYVIEDDEVEDQEEKVELVKNNENVEIDVQPDEKKLNESLNKIQTEKINISDHQTKKNQIMNDNKYNNVPIITEKSETLIHYHNNNPHISQSQDKTNKENEKQNLLPNKTNLNIELSKFQQNENANKQQTIAVKLKTKEITQHLKDKKIVVNVEEIEKQYLSGDKLTFEGQFDPNDANQLQKMREDLGRMHPRIFKDEKYEKYPVCTPTGWFCGCGSCGKSGLEKLGLGMVCYFKILKVFIVCFLIITLLNIPLYYIYYNNHTEKTITNYRDALFKTTIGNIASDTYMCVTIPTANILKSKTASMTFNMNCINSNVTSVVAYGISSDSNLDLDNMNYCTNFTSLNNIQTLNTCDFKDQLNTLINSNCKGKQSCSIVSDLNYIRSNCQHSSNQTFENFYLSYQCHTDYVTVGYNNLTISRGVMGFIITGIDIASMLVLLIGLFVISNSQERNKEQFKTENISICDYTLHLTNMKFSYTNYNQDLSRLLRHLNNVIEIETQRDKTRRTPFLTNLMKMSTEERLNFKYNDANSKIDLNVEHCSLFDVNYAYLTSDKLKGIREYNKLNSEKNNLEKISNQKDREDKLKLLEDKMKKTQERIKKEDQVKNVKELLLTFRNQKIAQFYYRTYKKNKCVRCCYIFCCKYDSIKHLYFDNKWLSITNVKDEPSNINWQNITYNPCKRFFRQFLSIVIAFIAIIISFAVVIGSKYSQEQISKSFNTNTDCTYVKYTEQLVLNEYQNNITTSNKVNLYCFCYNKLMSTGYTLTQEYKLSIAPTVAPCDEWVTLFLQFNAVNAAIVIIIPVVNSMLILLMKWLSLFEKHKTLTHQLSSAMWKMFILQFINTGLVIVLVNIYIQTVKNWWNQSPLFAGLFTDIDPGWYSVVGVTILFTMLINMAVPHFTVLLGMMVRLLTRCCDSGCSCGKRTKKTNKTDYFNLYVGPYFPIEVRYAEMLTTIFVALVFSAGIPIMYFCILGYVVLAYLVDKILILRFYRIPPKYDLYISKVFTNFLLIAILIHYCMGIWIYGNPQLLADNTSTSLDFLKNLITKYFASDNDYLNKIVARISMPHNILCLIFLAALIIFFFFRLTLLSFLQLLFSRKEILTKKNLEVGISLPLKTLYNNYQLRKIQFMKIIKSKANMDQQTFESLKNFYQTGINYDRDFIKYKLEKLTNSELSKLDMNFDEEIKLYLDKFKLEGDPILVGDVSYNIAYIPEYESTAYYEYLKNIY